MCNQSNGTTVLFIPEKNGIASYSLYSHLLQVHRICNAKLDKLLDKSAGKGRFPYLRVLNHRCIVSSESLKQCPRKARDGQTFCSKPIALVPSMHKCIRH